LGTPTDKPPGATRAPGPSRLDTLPEGFATVLKSRPFEVGEVVGGHFRLQRKLGDGGMGQVFVAENLSIGRQVAIKLLRPDLYADDSFRERFLKEAKAFASIEHRNVARFYDLVVGDPTFLVMEHVPGPTLAQVLKEGRLELGRATHVALRLCWALDAAHAAGVVHRDVKPSNVILAPDPEGGDEPKLIDFGLAKLASSTSQGQLTRNGQILGTPHYMSPEQIAGRAIDARSDVYSLGCLYFHMLSGRPPFLDGDDMQVLYRQIHEAPPRLDSVLPGAPPGMQAVLDRALAKAPEARFASMRELSEALRALSPRRTVGEPARAQPSPWPLVLAAGLSSALLGVAVMGLLQQRARSGPLLLVTSTPEGAQVKIDGRPVDGPTPAAVHALAPGKHRVRVELPGRNPAEQEVELGAGARLHVALALPEASHPVAVDSLPSGAQVFVDGVQVPGETPLSVTLANDDFHEIRVEKVGFESATRRVTPEERVSSLELTLEPERQPRGRLQIDSNEGGRVYIDGKATAYDAPTFPILVEKGSHLVELRDATGRRSAPARVEIRQGETVRVTLKLSEAP
jgi:serine/threonine-protein kinase